MVDHFSTQSFINDTLREMIFSTINQVAQWFEREKRESIIL